MKLFGKKKTNYDDVYVAPPKFYEKDDTVLGVFALTEGVETSLPMTPEYDVDGKQVDNWHLFLVSTTLQRPIGDVDYFSALQKLSPYVLHKDGQNVVIKKMSLDELKTIL